jgi:transcriptional regulator with XRE-family HTH domain
MTVADRAVLRIREEMAERKVSQRELADRLECSQGRVAKLLNGGVQLRVNDMALLATAVGITPVEALRDRGLEFFAELTPSEVRILERLRRRPNALQGALLMLGLDEPKTKPADAKRDARKGKRP